MNTRSLKWVWRGSALGVLLLGWMFILVINKFHVTPPVVYVMLAYLAGVAAIYALFRMGAAAVGDVEQEDPEEWGLPQGARDDLEREKKTLLKAIKEAEFDHQMGKLTKHDLDEMVRTYRLRAIDVIKLLEDTGDGSARDEIRREVLARVEVEALHAKVERAHAGLNKRRNPQKAAVAAQAAARAAAAAGASPAAAREAAAKAAVATDLEAEDDKAESKSAKKTDDKSEKSESKSDETDDKAEKAAAKSGDKADDNAAAKSDKADVKADDAAKSEDKAEAKSDDKADKSGDQAEKSADKADAKADTAAKAADKADAKADKADDKTAKAVDKADAKADDKVAKADKATNATVVGHANGDSAKSDKTAKADDKKSDDNAKEATS